MAQKNISWKWIVKNWKLKDKKIGHGDKQRIKRRVHGEIFVKLSSDSQWISIGILRFVTSNNL